MAAKLEPPELKRREVIFRERTRLSKMDSRLLDELREELGPNASYELLFRALFTFTRLSADACHRLLQGETWETEREGIADDIVAMNLSGVLE